MLCEFLLPLESKHGKGRTGFPFFVTAFFSLLALLRKTLTMPATLLKQDHSRVHWDSVRAGLREEFGVDVFSSWFACLEFESAHDGAVQLSVPTRFLKQWIQQTYRERLLSLWQDADAHVRRIEIVVRGSVAQRALPTLAQRRPASSAPALPTGTTFAPIGPASLSLTHSEPSHGAATQAEDHGGSPLDKRLTLESFVVGRSNSLAHAAAMQVATAKPNDPVQFNPLHIHAGVGHGKTHLMHAVAHKLREQGRKVLYLTAERFMYGFVTALKNQSALAFKEQLRGIDLLIIDDLQFLQGKHVQAEFGHTLNALLDGSRQVMIAADRPPAELECLDERMRSRLAGGLVVEMGAPAEEMRLGILRSKAEAAKERYPNLDVPEDVLSFVARSIVSNGRDLDGAFNRLLAHNQLTHAPLTVDMAEDVIRDLVRVREPRKVLIEEIQRMVAKHYNSSRADLLSSRRTRNVVLPRQVAMYLSKALTPRSLPEIGRRFGGRDHTTVLHAVRKIEDLVKSDRQLAQDVEHLKRLLLDV